MRPSFASDATCSACWPSSERADRILRDQQFNLQADPLQELEREQDKTKQLAASISAKLAGSKDIGRQADLLLLRSPMMNRRFEYGALAS